MAELEKQALDPRDIDSNRARRLDDLGFRWDVASGATAAEALPVEIISSKVKVMPDLSDVPEDRSRGSRAFRSAGAASAEADQGQKLSPEDQARKIERDEFFKQKWTEKAQQKNKP